MSTKIFKSFWQQVNDGVAGRNTGLPIGYPKLEEYLNGIHRGRYYTLFSEGGTGKSAFTWTSFIINPIDYMLSQPEGKIKVVANLYSLEVVAPQVLAKLICLKIYRDTGLIVDPDYVLSYGKNRVRKEIYHLVYSYRQYFENLMTNGTLNIMDGNYGPREIKKDIDQYAAANGTFYKDENGKQRYKANSPDDYVMIITDTVGNLKLEDNAGKVSTKGTIDLHSATCRDYYRDTLNYIPINISHSNRSMSDPTRAKMGEVFPKMSDIKETNMLEQDSSVVMTIFNPMNHITISKALENFMGYDIKKLKDRFRCLGILKNRHGAVNKRVGLLFIGENGHFQELPSSKDMTAFDYGKILSLKHARFLTKNEIDEVSNIKQEEADNTDE